MKTEIFNYNGNPVTFKMENGEVMVSATEMANLLRERRLVKAKTDQST